jgi:tRNA (guanine-N7-)-methyltransferase
MTIGVVLGGKRAFIMARRQLKEYPDIILMPENIKGKVNFYDIFGRDGEVHIEIGSGRGTFLVSQAKAFERVNFLGIEWASKYYRYIVDRIGRQGLKNVRVIRTEAASFITNCVDDGTVNCFHIYFPDPWPKKRHHKRRFVCETNVAQMIRCLKEGGLINAATDHAEYFEQMKDVFANFAKVLKEVEFVKPAGAQADELVGTNYERKYLKEKRIVYTIAFRKI